MSDQEIITWLIQQVNDLKVETAALQEIIFKSQGLLEEKVIVPEGSGAHIGKEPWYRKKRILENAFRIQKEPVEIGVKENASQE